MIPTRPRANAIAVPNFGRQGANAASTHSGGARNVGRNAQPSPITQQFTGAGVAQIGSMPVLNSAAGATANITASQGARANVASTLTTSQIRDKVNR